MSYTTLKEYIESLQQLVKNDPSLAELPLYFSLDDEGNYYKNVYNPQISIVYTDKEALNDYVLESIYSQDDMDLYFDSSLYSRIGILY